MTSYNASSIYYRRSLAVRRHALFLISYDDRNDRGGVWNRKRSIHCKSAILLREDSDPDGGETIIPARFGHFTATLTTSSPVYVVS